VAAHVLIDEVEAAITRDESGNLLAILNQLSAHALTNSRVWLLGLDATAKANANAHVRIVSREQTLKGCRSKHIVAL